MSDESAGNSSNRRIAERKIAEGHTYLRVSDLERRRLQGYVVDYSAVDYSLYGLGMQSLDEMTLKVGHGVIVEKPRYDGGWNSFLAIVRHSDGKRHGLEVVESFTVGKPS